MYKNLEKMNQAFLESVRKQQQEELEEIETELNAINKQQPEFAAELGMSTKSLDGIERKADEIFNKRYGHLNILEMTEEQHFELYAPILEELLSPSTDVDDVQ